MSDAVGEMRLVRGTRLVDEITVRLRTLILDGVLPPGKPLLQLDLCEQLGVSRTPLREAFRILENEGFVRIANGNKTLEVIDLSAEDMRELYAFREAVDGLAARLTAQRGVTSGELEELREMTVVMGESALGAVRTLSHADFHARLAELSGNRYVIGQIPMIRLTAQMMARRVRSLAASAPEHADELLDEGKADHQGVVAAIEAGDARQAEAIARRHIRKTMRSLLLRG